MRELDSAPKIDRVCPARLARELEAHRQWFGIERGEADVGVTGAQILDVLEVPAVHVRVVIIHDSIESVESRERSIELSTGPHTGLLDASGRNPQPLPGLQAAAKRVPCNLGERVDIVVTNHLHVGVERDSDRIHGFAGQHLVARPLALLDIRGGARVVSAIVSWTRIL